MILVTQQFWPLAAGRIITSPYGPRDGGYHYGTETANLIHAVRK